VRSIEADADGLLKVESLCNYFQEVAGNHAHHLGVATDQLTGHGLAWVLGRLCFSVSGWPRWRESVRLETWPSGVDRLYAFRDLLAFDGVGAPFAEGISTWLLIDTERRRPVRMPDFVTGIPLPDRPRALNGIQPAPIEPDGPCAIERVFDVFRSDIDGNRHVNNVRFLVWILESLPETARERAGTASIDISFRAEAVYGDCVRVCTWDQGSSATAGSSTFLHRVFHADSDRLLASASTVWAGSAPS
jgi:acyl-ACP thioesterase